MRVLHIVFLGNFICCVFGGQHRYTVYQENITVDFQEDKLIRATAKVYKLSDTENGLNITAYIKFDVPHDAKFLIKAYKWMNNDYRMGFIEINKTVKDVMEMEMFDLQALWVTNCHPPLVWPIEKGITYRSIGWNPDSSKFPPNVPEGRYKVRVTIAFANKTNIVTANWFVRAVYSI